MAYEVLYVVTVTSGLEAQELVVLFGGGSRWIVSRKSQVTVGLLAATLHFDHLSIRFQSLN